MALMIGHLAHGTVTLAVDFVTFNRPQWWLVMIPVFVLLVWIGRKSLSGMGTRMRRLALLIRILVAALVVAAIAEPQWRKESKSVSVTAILDVSRSQPTNVQAATNEFLKAASKGARDGDRLGMVTAGREAYIQQLPQLIAAASTDSPNIGATDGTNLEAAVRIALASMPPDAANRLVLVSDGNENIGHLVEAVNAAKAAGVPIDVLPIRYVNNAEVLVERLIAPSVARQGENAKLRVVLTATRATRGELSIMLDGQPIDLNGADEGTSKLVRLVAGQNVEETLVKLPRTSGPARYEAVFTPNRNEDGSVGDTVLDNNRASAVTFVGGEGRVLVLSVKQDEASQLVNALTESKIGVEVRSPETGPQALAELAAYECIVLVNTPRYAFTQQQQEDLKSYVHDMGGGLVMIGGDESFGAGGWIGSSLADALPIKLDPPQKREMPRGALVLIMHSCEMPEGNYWGRRTGEAAIKALASKDLIGLLEFNWQGGGGGDSWVHPIREVGDKSAALRAINSLTYGDAPSFDQLIGDAYAGLMKVTAGQKHIVIISDGDPQLTNNQILADCKAAKITISTVAVFPHSYGNASADLNKMRMIAKETGGEYHAITTNQGSLKDLPEIFIKEARTVKRSLIWEGDAFSPAVSYASDAMRGLSSVPALTGYVVAADREGLSQVVLRGKENDPILAQWQYGLGRSVTFTSDATGKWAKSWLAWPQYRAFWEQHIRWAMRPAGSPNVRVTTEERGDQTAVIVEALDDKGERLNFLRWKGRIVNRDASGKDAEGDVDLRQVGPGRYEALVNTSSAGIYTMHLGYQGVREGQELRGSVQAAVTRPFADEFRSLHDNAPMLEQVAKATGGEVLTFEDSGNPDKNPWRRAGLATPVSLQPIFMSIALIAMGMLLMDVAVRRVRIDARAIVGAVGKVFRRGKASAGEQVESLKAAREKARQRLDAQRDAKPSVGQSVPIAQQAAAYANKKFEASAEELRASRGSSVVDAPPVERAAPVKVKSAKKDEAGGAGAEGEGMSRLLKAKKRAQDEIGDGG